MEDGWKRTEDELCHRCLTAAAVYSTVGLRIKSIVRSREKCAALTRPCPRWVDDHHEGEEEENSFVYKSCRERRKKRYTSIRQRQHTNSH